MKYVLANEQAVVRTGVIDFQDVYGPPFAECQLNLFKYFAKMLGCDLAAHGRSVPSDVRLLLDQEHFLTRFLVRFAINEDKLLLPNASWRPLGFRDLLTTQRNLQAFDDPKYSWGLYFSSVEVSILYDWVNDGPYGAPWIANSRFLYFGRLSPLCEAEREYGRQKLVELSADPDVQLDNVARYVLHQMETSKALPENGKKKRQLNSDP